MSNTCPCEICISYAICNSIVKAMNRPDVSYLSIDKKCEDLKVYLNVYEADITQKHEDRDNINRTRALFGLKPMPNYHILKPGGGG